ncbi:MAG: restriction endonuclease subunit R, partial [Proteobacteria bacterium]|nr:restriction endonuclease subunit R [Pseudomonadota bacterium]
MIDPEDLQNQLQKALRACALLREENERLKKLLGLHHEDRTPTPQPSISEPSTPYTSADHVTNDSSIETQIALFRSLFRGREDVYPIRWEGRKGNSGYSPACANEWNLSFCGKPMVKCADCENRVLKPVTDEVIVGHLLGKHTIGVYPLLTDETCWFLAVDFDKKAWQEDAAVFLKTCEEMGVPAALERSRSGKGGHIWIFFERPVQASLA